MLTGTCVHAKSHLLFNAIFNARQVTGQTLCETTPQNVHLNTISLPCCHRAEAQLSVLPVSRLTNRATFCWSEMWAWPVRYKEHCRSSSTLWIHLRISLAERWENRLDTKGFSEQSFQLPKTPMLLVEEPTSCIHWSSTALCQKGTGVTCCWSWKV